MIPKRYGVVIVVSNPSLPEMEEQESEEQILQRRFLMIRRSQSVIAPGKLCFPGGGIESGESPEEAAIREFKEEMGLDIVVIRQIWENITPWEVHLDWFSAKIIDPVQKVKIAPKEVAEFSWMTLQEILANPDTLTSNIPFLENLCSVHKP